MLKILRIVSLLHVLNLLLQCDLPSHAITPVDYTPVSVHPNVLKYYIHIILRTSAQRSMSPNYGNRIFQKSCSFVFPFHKEFPTR